MRFFGFKEFRPGLVDDIKGVITYLSRDLKSSLRELTTGLTKLSFADNFKSFQATITIEPGAELAISNQLDLIPTIRLIVKSDIGGLDITDGDTKWSENFVYLKNTGATAGTVTVVFLA